METLSEELTLLKTRDNLESDKEERIATVRYESEAIAKELKQQDEHIEPHVSDDDFTEEYAGVRKYQALITRMRTQLGRLQRKSVSGGCTDSGSATAVSSTSNAEPLMLPELERQKTSADRLHEIPHENDALSYTERDLDPSAAPMDTAAAAVSGIQGTEQNYECAINTSKESSGQLDVPLQVHLTQPFYLQTAEELDE
ncbi:hypothetical protein MTO96_035303, partial [Rhipicephalus appendiculatus]